MIRPVDDQLSIELANDIAEVGGAFAGHIRRAPLDGVSNDATVGSVREIRVRLVMETEGRGDSDSKRYEEVSALVDEHGMTSQPFQLPVPIDAPVSYDGSLMRIRWHIEGRTDRKFAIDAKVSAEVLVVPEGGLDLYTRPLPLR